MHSGTRQTEEEMTYLERALNTPGWFSEPEMEYIATIAEKSKVIVEIGSFKGRSTLALAQNTSGIVYAVDHWEGSPEHKDHLSGYPRGWLFDEFTVNLEGITNVWPISRSSAQTAAWFRATGRTADFVFVDGSHDFASVKNDIENWMPLLADGGVLAGHDYGDGWPDVEKAVKLLVPKFRLVPGGSIWTTEGA
jgi:hypothetical protein